MNKMKLLVGNVRCEIQEASDSQLESVRDTLTCWAPDFQFSPLYRQKLWDGKARLLKQNTFPTGCLPRVLEELKGKVELADHRPVRSLQLCRNVGIPLRPYQTEVVNRAFSNSFQGLWWPRGVVEVATGGGKTIIAAAMAKAAPVPSIFIVDTDELAVQASKAFTTWGVAHSRSLEDEAQVWIITIQSLMAFRHKVNQETESGHKRTAEQVASIREKKAAAELRIRTHLNRIGQVFVDEAHGIAANLSRGNLMYQALELLPNAYLRWGLTATPFQRDSFSNLLLEGATGARLCQVPAQQLISLGYCSAPKITMYRVNEPNTPTDWATSYTYGVVLSNRRNDIIVRDALARRQPCLIMVDSINHGQILQSKFAALGHRVPFLNGQESKDVRNAAVARLDAGLDPIVIASKIWSKGVDFPRLRTVIVGGAKKSGIVLKQILGRGMRTAPGKTSFDVVDFVDESTRTLRGHSMERRKVYTEQGYEVEVLD